MAKIFTSVGQLIGNTPLMHLHVTEKTENLSATLLAKLEFFNPGGSVKDRVGLAMIRDAEQNGLLKKDSVIIEPTSGNTGIGLACVAASLGYKTILVMPDTMSIERRKLLAAFGAEIELTDGKLGMQGAVNRAKELSEQYPGSYIPNQFSNSSNAMAHEKSTGPEIWDATDGQIDIFVAGVGTGGTISGVGKYLKSRNPNIQIVAVEPAASPLLSGGNAGSHGIMGIGANFIPDILDRNIIDPVITVTDQEAYTAARQLGKTEGLLVGISSGAALHAAITLAKLKKNLGKKIVVLLPDTGERYLSTPLFE